MADQGIREGLGIGPTLAACLCLLGVKTAADQTAMPDAVARVVGTVVLERLVRELNGIECTEFEPKPASLKSTAVTRYFRAEKAANKAA